MVPYSRRNDKGVEDFEENRRAGGRIAKDSVFAKWDKVQAKRNGVVSEHGRCRKSKPKSVFYKDIVKKLIAVKMQQQKNWILRLYRKRTFNIQQQ